ncbi:hypothetical protein L0222_01570 [bacterium]|nr:hypothetical protein [bacterium]MCI0605054.1 hypothetical protein [bacterium]
MFKKSLLIFAFLMASVCFVMAQSSEQPPETNQPAAQPTETAQPAATEQNTQVQGTIAKIDHKKMMMTLKVETTNEEKEFTFTDTTSFSKEEKNITHNELKKGDRVLLELDSSNNLLRVTVEPKKSTE